MHDIPLNDTQRIFAEKTTTLSTSSCTRRICLPASIMTSSFSATCGRCSGI